MTTTGYSILYNVSLQCLKSFQSPHLDFYVDLRGTGLLLFQYSLICLHVGQLFEMKSRWMDEGWHQLSYFYIAGWFNFQRMVLLFNHLSLFCTIEPSRLDDCFFCLLILFRLFELVVVRRDGGYEVNMWFSNVGTNNWLAQICSFWLILDFQDNMSDIHSFMRSWQSFEAMNRT